MVVDASRHSHGSLTAALCLDAMIGDPAPDYAGRLHAAATTAASSSSSSGGGGSSAQAGGHRSGGSGGDDGDDKDGGGSEIDLLLSEFAMDDAALYGSDALPFELLVRAVLSRRPHRPALLNVMG